jgi:hypothetical protein
MHGSGMVRGSSKVNGSSMSAVIPTTKHSAPCGSSPQPTGCPWVPNAQAVPPSTCSPFAPYRPNHTPQGGAAILLSNEARYHSTAKYQLMHNVRTHQGADDASYSCMGWGPDKDGINGVYLRRDVPIQAAKALEVCLRAVAPHILTWRQYGEAAANLVQKRLFGWQVRPRAPAFWGVL